MTDSPFLGGEGRRRVLRVVHDVDEQGVVIDVQLETVAAASAPDAAWAAWQIARRRHPWIIGDYAREQLEAAQAIAIRQTTHLLSCADEALLLLTGVKHDAVERLRGAAIDLRHYLPALRGEIPPFHNTFRRVS